MSHFFMVYKALEKKDTAVDEVMDEREAVAVIENAIAAYNEMFPDGNE